jgi:hypothetical protein
MYSYIHIYTDTIYIYIYTPSTPGYGVHTPEYSEYSVHYTHKRRFKSSKVTKQALFLPFFYSLLAHNANAFIALNSHEIAVRRSGPFRLLRNTILYTILSSKCDDHVHFGSLRFCSLKTKPSHNNPTFDSEEGKRL